MVPGVELVLGYLTAWAVRKARRVGSRADGHIDEAIDAGIDRLGELVVAKLDGDPALDRFEAEAARGGASERTRTRLQLALEDAAADDPLFAAALQRALAAAQETNHGPAAAACGEQGTAVGRDVSIHAQDGSVASWQIDTVNFGGQQGPSGPGRSRV
jgi:hypothetical protein